MSLNITFFQVNGDIEEDSLTWYQLKSTATNEEKKKAVANQDKIEKKIPRKLNTVHLDWMKKI